MIDDTLETGEQATLRGWDQGVLEIIDEIEWIGPLMIRYKGTDGTEPEAMKGGYDESKRFPISGTLNLKDAKWFKSRR